MRARPVRWKQYLSNASPRRFCFVLDTENMEKFQEPRDDDVDQVFEVEEPEPT